MPPKRKRPSANSVNQKQQQKRKRDNQENCHDFEEMVQTTENANQPEENQVRGRQGEEQELGAAIQIQSVDPVTNSAPKTTISATTFNSGAEVSLQTVTQNVLAELVKLINSSVVTVPPPTFEGTNSEDPIEFFQNFERYCKMRNFDDKTTLETAVECLKKNAAHWASIFSPQWNCYEKFKRDFLKYYWSDSKQREVRSQISTGKYDESNGSMMEHFAYLVYRAKQLTPQIPEETLVADLMQHFSQRVRQVWALNSETTVNEAASFLAKMDAVQMKAQSVKELQVNTGNNQESESNEFKTCGIQMKSRRRVRKRRRRTGRKASSSINSFPQIIATNLESREKQTMKTANGRKKNRYRIRRSRRTRKRTSTPLDEIGGV